MANLSAFEDYFRRADLDRDGKISGQEAVAFFQGANLPQVTLAKIWQFADQGQSGYLTKLEFFNALKLVTVAQAGRDLTPEIVRAALAGPAAAQIPAPRIVTPGPPPPSYVTSQGTGYSTQYPSASGAPPNKWSSQPSVLPTNTAQVSVQAGPRPGSASGVRTGFVADDWPSVKSASGTATHTSTSQLPTSAGAASQNFQVSGNSSLPAQGQVKKDAFGGFGVESGKLPNGGGAGLKGSLSDAFDGDPFAAAKPSLALTVQKPSTAGATSQGFADFGDGGFKASSVSTNALVPVDVPPRPVVKESVSLPAVSVSRPGVAVSLGQGYASQVPSTPGVGAPWPRMSESDAQRYTRVFSEVDRDRDGKITGEEARDLFLSWGLPREVLKQVWDLSDQDMDSMLSLREFCTALYLMERYREGRPLPPVLPTGLQYDDRPADTWQNAATRPSFSAPTANYNIPSWQQTSGFPQPSAPASVVGLRPGIPAGPDRRVAPVGASVGGAGVEAAQTNVYKSKAPPLEMHLVNQLSRDEQENLKTKQKAAEEADKKVYELDKEIMNYREKAEYYRTKLQEIILFKSRCDNKLSEITERAAADKREMEALAKKYDERFKAAGEVNSRLQTEEAVFRDIQEKKMELYSAIIKLEQGGDANGLLQNKAERISSDLDNLKKALSERARRLGLNVKITASEQQFGWQPGLQENASEWDEDWDKFDDEGFVAIQEFSDGADGVPAASPVTGSGGVRETTDVFESPVESTSPPRSAAKVDEVSDDSRSGPAPSELASPRADSETSGRSGVDSPTTSSPQAAAGRANFDKPESATKPSQRYANVAESQDFGGGDDFNNPTSFSSTTASFDQGPPSYSSINDTFGDGGASWSATFSHDDEVDSGVRASWGLQSYPSSTQASFDVPGNRTSRFGRTGLSTTSHGFENAFDSSSVGISSPGRTADGLSSPAQSYRSNGTFNFRDSEDFDAFGSPRASKDFDRSPKFVGGYTVRGSSVFDSPRSRSGASFSRFDSFSSPQNNPASVSSPPNNPAFSGSGYAEDRHDLSHMHANNERSFSRFDSFGSVKSDAGRTSKGVFTSYDDADDLFAGSGPFRAGSDEKKTSELGWSNF
ncbi:hypothetical protein R1sor_020534 [Riccia sorocarpa]|uniref:Uncharacterized protein n=1 Tax=Riccia sorocarpa TaxID=122646 RepID=A0ABD3IFU4_9MARC